MVLISTGLKPRAGRYARPPAWLTARQRPKPKEWYTGTPTYSRISEVTAMTPFKRLTTSAKFWWLSTTPFGSPSVPEVNRICARLSSSRRGRLASSQP
jgi:hypothetical protein